MKKLLLHKFSEYLVFITFFILLEIWTYVSMFNFIPEFFWLDLILVTFFALVIFLFKPIIFDIVYLTLWFVGFTFLSIVGINYYHMFLDIPSSSYLYMINANTGALMEGYNFDISSIAVGIGILVAFVAAVSSLNIYFSFKHKDVKAIKYYTYASVPSLSFILLSAFSFNIAQIQATEYDRTVNGNLTADNVMIAKATNYSRYGMLSYYYKEFFSKFDIDETTISRFLQTNATNDPAFNGLLEGYNVITVMIETGSQYMLNETLTPTLYELTTNGVNCSNNYSKNKTNITEMIGIMGSKPTNLNPGNEKALTSSYPYSTANLLNAKDYNTYFIHDVGSNNDIYNRRKFNKALGFDKVYLHEEIFPGVPGWGWGSYPADSLTIKNMENLFTVDELKNNPFYMFWTSLSMHGPYYGTSTNKYMRSLYEDELKDAESKGLWVNPLKDDTSEVRRIGLENYMMSCMDFDRAMESLISYLKTNNLFDNTLLVLYGDHEVYYNCDGKPLNLVLSGRDSLEYSDIFKTYMSFYNPTLNSKFNEVYKTHNVTNFTSPYNVVPSILDLLGVNYASSIYPGKSIFSKNFQNEGDIFYSYELGATFTEKYWSKDNISITNKFTDNTTTQEDERFLSALKTRIYFQTIMDSIYDEGYFDNHSLF